MVIDIKRTLRTAVTLTVASILFIYSLGCQVGSKAQPDNNSAQGNAHSEHHIEEVEGVVDFEHELDSYVPKKDSYSFYFTYKIVHPWWDAVALGMEEAQRQYQERGVLITYEYMAPDMAYFLEGYANEINKLADDHSDE